jgi:poly(3-hydroxybutyrate) depolymerase
MTPVVSRTARRVALVFAVAVVALTGVVAPANAAGSGLPRLNVSRDYVTGISSGGYMATQLQIAYSSRFRGAGIFSAGPYWCAQGNVVIALQACSDDTVPIDLPTLYAQTDQYAQQQKIDPLANLTGSSTYFFHGTLDPTVKTPVADALATYYRHYGVPLTYRNTLAAGHGWISPLGPVPCGYTAAPYINNCSPYDAEADLLRTMTGAATAPNTGTPKGKLTTFSQDPYAVPPAPGNGDITRTGAAAIGMGATGYLYTPNACSGRATCALVVALHGCLQTAEQIGDTFAKDSWLNQYADTNHLVVLYPQARPDATFGNPKGCWDWWGYLGAADTDYATKLGPQMRTVMRMVTALGG